MTHPRAARHFPQLQLSTDVASREEARPAELGNGHRTHYLPSKASGIRTVASANPLKLLGLTTGWESGHLGLRPARFQSLQTNPFSIARVAYCKGYGMETVLPYVGPVKRLSLYIVSQAINGWDAGADQAFATETPADLSKCRLLWWSRRSRTGPFRRP